MDNHLQQLLRSLCLNTEWNYAVFWKLRHRARMVLALEDAYCETLGSLRDGQIRHDALGLAVAKMSYHVYSLGEGYDLMILICARRQNSYDALPSANKFGYALHEALGAAFLKQNYPSWCEAEKSEPVTVSGIEDGMEDSMLTSDTVTDHLLEAVVSSCCHKDSTFKRVKWFSSSVDSLLTTEKMPDPSSITSHTVSSACYSIDGSTVTEESIKHCLTSSDLYSMRTSKGNKKRARPGEKCRPPRPRDRQLIQERIKELRELVPNGSKCSIESLLQRTIKHTLFLQSISKHADKLNNCARLRVNKDGCSSSEQGCKLGSGGRQPYEDLPNCGEKYQCGWVAADRGLSFNSNSLICECATTTYTEPRQRLQPPQYVWLNGLVSLDGKEKELGRIAQYGCFS